MDQADFRKLLNSSSGPVDASASAQKRSRGQAFGVRSGATQSTKSFLAPRTKRRTTNQASKGETSSTDTTKSRQTRTLAAGYIDRTKQRHDNTTKDGDQERLDELRDDLKQKRITHKEYLEQVETFATGDFSHAGIVRGLDRKLLERVRAGEDVLDQKEEADVSKTEEELDQALDNLKWSAKVQDTSADGAKEAASIAAPKNRDSLLARIKKAESPSVKPAQESTAPSGFVPIMKRNKDGTTTQTCIENGKKVKIIRDETGKIMKKLVKKIELQPGESSNRVVEVQRARVITKESPASIEKESSAALKQSAEDDFDIFENVGEYDPFSTTMTAQESSTVGQEKSTGRQTYFDDEEMVGEGEDVEVPTTARDFLQQNRLALEKAAKLMDAQEKKELDRVAAKRKQDAGFGLVFKDSDAYAGDLREVPDDEEIYDKKRDGGQRRAARTKDDTADV